MFKFRNLAAKKRERRCHFAFEFWPWRHNWVRIFISEPGSQRCPFQAGNKYCIAEIKLPWSSQTSILVKDSCGELFSIYQKPGLPKKIKIIEWTACIVHKIRGMGRRAHFKKKAQIMYKKSLFPTLSPNSSSTLKVKQGPPSPVKSHWCSCCFYNARFASLVYGSWLSRHNEGGVRGKDSYTSNPNSAHPLPHITISRALSGATLWATWGGW